MIKLAKREERKANPKKTFEESIAYIDENGNFTDTPPDKSKRTVIKAEDIEIGIPTREADNSDPIKKGKIGPVVLGRDHHDVSGTDSPFRETSNIYDGSSFTADMAIQNVIGDSFRGATWVSIHNGGGVGWGEVINGGFGMLLDGSSDAERRLKSGRMENISFFAR